MIYDISKELFSADVYPGDPVPKIETVLSLYKSQPDQCNLSRITLGSHSGTHIDAPLHFCAGGNDVSEIPLEKCMGRCRIVTHDGIITQKQIDEWSAGGIDKILIHGNVEIDIESAKCIVKNKINCIGVEMNTITGGKYQNEVHRILLNAEIIIIEGLVLEQVPDGFYFLSALPLKMRKADGSPVRAIVYN